MLFERTPFYFILIPCLVTMYFLFSVKENVMNRRAQLNHINKQIQYEKDTIHLLKAEFSYLSSPKRLAMLNDKYLSLKPSHIAQISDDIMSDERVVLASAPVHNKPVKWNYKKGPSKYVTVSAKFN